MSDFSEKENKTISSISSLVKGFVESRKQEPVIELVETVEETIFEELYEVPEVILLENVDTEHHVENANITHTLSLEEIEHLNNVPDVQLVESFKTGEEDEEELNPIYIKDFDPSAGFDFKSVDLEVVHLPLEEEQYSSYADNNDTNTNVGEVIDGVYVIKEKEQEEIPTNYETRFQSGATELMSDLTLYNDDKDNNFSVETIEAVEELKTEVEYVDMPDMTDFDPTKYFGIQQSDRPTRPEKLVEIVELEERRGTYEEAVDALANSSQASEDNVETVSSLSILESDKGNRSISDMLKELSSLKDKK